MYTSLSLYLFCLKIGYNNCYPIISLPDNIAISILHVTVDWHWFVDLTK